MARDLSELEERIAAIARSHQFEPIRDEAAFRKQVEEEVRAELAKWIESGDLKPAGELVVDVHVSPGGAPPMIEVKVAAEKPPAEDAEPKR
jgi:hypothetical protein